MFDSDERVENRSRLTRSKMRKSPAAGLDFIMHLVVKAQRHKPRVFEGLVLGVANIQVQKGYLGSVVI
jgi:hypothetical protein